MCVTRWVKLDRLFEDKLSGANQERAQLQACLSYLRDGDVLHVHSIDRLARNLLDLQTLVSALTGRGVEVRFHQEGLTFSGSASDPMHQDDMHRSVHHEFDLLGFGERSHADVAVSGDGRLCALCEARDYAESITRTPCWISLLWPSGSALSGIRHRCHKPRARL